MAEWEEWRKGRKGRTEEGKNGRTKEFAGSGWEVFRDTWLWVCFNISQSGRPVVLFGGGSPADFENLPRRRYFSKIHYLALTCDPDVLERRLHARPTWRNACRPEFIKTQKDWNQWFIDNEQMAVPPYSRLDTTDKTKAACTKALIDWINRSLRKEV